MAAVPDFESFQSLAEAFYSLARKEPDLVVYRQALYDPNTDENGSPRQRLQRTFSEVETRVTKIAHYLKSIGVTKGSKVAIVSSSRPEWMECDLAAHTLGAVVVSIYQSVPADDVGYILFDSDAHVVFAENQEQVDKLNSLLSGTIDIPATEDRDATTAQVGLKKIIAFEQVSDHPLVAQLSGILAGPKPDHLDAYKTLNREDLAALVYTSGTTGPPKGVMQTQGNHLANVRQAYECRLVTTESTLMVFLPLAHAFAKLMGYLGFIAPAELEFPAIKDTKTSKMEPDSVTRDIREFGAEIVPVVPRLLEKMEAGVKAKANAGGLRGKLLTLMLGSARGVYGGNPSLGQRIGYALTGFLRKKVKAQLFGEGFRYAISGGAKLNPDVGRFFDMLGIEILEGYGLTETCVATNVNRYGQKKIGSVGPVLADDIELRIGEDGEILFRGPNITKGYYNRETATRNAWDADGWFHTGDLGEVDENGFLSIVGRKKDILVTSYGKNIAPEDIEAQMKSSLYISAVLLIGDGRPFISALVSIDLQAVSAWAKKRGISDLDNKSLAKNEAVQDLIWKELERANKEFADYEQAKKFRIVPEDFTVENGMLTPTFKVKRPVVMKQYAALIEEIYAGA
ncbi:MAG: long-chain fatty acid--CoA ligase [Bdellovibrionales bacterium]|nr:long-chain fatty acid--CoA ligase [Bdellovibrionales bacterium]